MQSFPRFVFKQVIEKTEQKATEVRRRALVKLWYPAAYRAGVKCRSFSPLACDKGAKANLVLREKNNFIGKESAFD